MSSGHPFAESSPFEPGQRLQCPTCGSEIEIVVSGGSADGALMARCCGADMVPTVPAES